MDEIRPNKLNLDDLCKRKQKVAIMTTTTYNTVLERIHKRVQTCSRQRTDNQSCWFVVPELMIGSPRYDVRLCIAYLIRELEDNGFQVKYTHPNLLFICWKHWVPDYVRSEVKKQTGVAIDGFGNELAKKEVVKPVDPRFTPTASYKPTGRFVYSDDLLK
jgi:hypothetical protein